MKEYKSELELCKEAQQLQNGCNPLGIAETYRSIIRSLMDNGFGSTDAAKHPASKATLGKLCDLAAMDHDSEVYQELQDWINYLNSERPSNQDWYTIRTAV